jgi:hypothetical protein
VPRPDVLTAAAEHDRAARTVRSVRLNAIKADQLSFRFELLDPPR